MSFDDDRPDDDLEDDPENPDESDMDPTDSVDNTDPCPYCGRPLYERAEACPHCGNYISQEDSRSHNPLWLILGVIFCVAMILWVWVVKNW